MRKDKKVASFDPLKVLQEFNTLHNAVIDACSMIYLDRVDLLDSLLQWVNLKTPLTVFREAGLHRYRAIQRVRGQKKMTADEQLIDLAWNCNCPLISYDGLVLLRAEESGLSYFNSLMMLYYLYFKREIDLQTLLDKERELLSFAYHAGWIQQAARSLLPHLRAKD